ncbi:hypothetical protein OB959_14305 [Aeromonas bestiarum]|uniref:Uncharacterized protein n=1 Tax=Aeromonas bestiarum TaxID=105751 RepID=A0AAW7I1X0_9GAMM|nr:hypothetical protein [Aeromonas bestiarum]MDM5140960.1 hypothetical protein [Aeromonas bestiarum]
MYNLHSNVTLSKNVFNEEVNMIRKILPILFCLSAMNVTANTAWFTEWQAYKPINWQKAGTWHSCIIITNISSGSIEVAVNYYGINGSIATPPLTGSNNTPKATLAPRQTAHWCTDPSKLAEGTNLWGAGTVMATPLDDQTEPALVIATAEMRSIDPSGIHHIMTNIPINGGLPF